MVDVPEPAAGLVVGGFGFVAGTRAVAGAEAGEWVGIEVLFFAAEDEETTGTI